METGTQLTVIERAALALKSTEIERTLVDLAQQSKEIVAITNPASYQQVHSSRMTLKNHRITIEKAGKAARDDATKFSKAVIQEQARLVAIIEPDELRLEAIQREHDDRLATEKAAREQADRERIERIQAAIQEIKMVDAGLTVMSGSTLIMATIEGLQREPLDERFAEFKADAEKAKVLSMMRLNSLHAGALEYEAEQRRVKAEREELARMKAEEDKRQREAAEREAAEIRVRAEADAKRRAEIAAEERAAAERIAAQERAAQAERDRADREQRERLAAQEAEAKRLRDAEDKRLQAERDRLAAEARALEDRQRKEREETEARERAAREAQEAEDRAAEAKARQEQEAEEARQRELQRKADETLDARAMLVTFSDRYGEIKEFSGVVKAINTYFAKHGDPRRGEQDKAAA
jgi:hypothetical protein